MGGIRAWVASSLCALSLAAGAQGVQWSSMMYGAGNPPAFPGLEGGEPEGQAKKAMKVDAAGNVLLAGRFANDPGGPMRTVKYAAGTGAVLWQSLLEVPGASHNVANALAVDGAGNAIVVGYVNNPNQQARAVKYSAANGAVLWEMPAGNGAHHGVAVDASGDVFVTGNVMDGSFMRLRVMKLSGASGAMLWEQTFTGTSNTDTGADLVVDAAGDVVVIGLTSNGANWDRITLKYAGGTGVRLWVRGNAGAGGGSDMASAVALDAQGNVIVTGSAYTDAAANQDVRTIKYDGATGATLWQSDYNAAPGSYEEGFAVAVNAAGDVFVAGLRFVGGSSKMLALKLSGATGARAWDYVSTAVGVSAGLAVTVDAAGNPIVAGIGFDASPDFHTVKLASATGAVLWSQYLGSDFNLDRAFAIAMDPSGNVVTGGWGFYASTPDFKAMKQDSATGALLWESGTRLLPQAANMPSAFNGRSTLTRDAAGNAIVAGNAWNGQNYDIKVTKYAAATGAVIWEGLYNGPVNGEDRVSAVAVDSAGNVMVAGSTDVGGGYTGMHVVRFAAATGAVVWTRTYFVNFSTRFDYATAIAVDANDNTIVAGVYGEDVRVVKISPAASDLWDRSWAGQANGLDEPSAIAIDAGGNAVVAGKSRSSAGGFDAVVLKFAAADGTLLWANAFIGAANGDDLAKSLALDASGNAIMAGNTSNGANNDAFVAKYAAGNGAQLWARTLNGAANLGDQAFSVAVDGAGDVVVAGSTTDAAGQDALLVKYSGLAGRTLWMRTFGAIPGGQDVFYALALDAAGNPIATGGSVTASGFSDFVTAKFAAADGAQLWESRYAATWNLHDYAFAAVAVPGAVYVAGNCFDTSLQAVCTVRIEDTGVGAGSDARVDFNGDDNADIVWQHADGRTALWVMHGAQQAGGAALLGAGSGWTPKLLADFNRDSFTDIVWQHTDGRVAMWLMRKDAQIGGGLLFAGGTGWVPVATGDFDGDGNADIVFQHADGRVALWLMQGAQQVGGGLLFGARTGWSLRLVGDFDGDGTDDILWAHRDGRHALWLMSRGRQAKGAVIMPAGLGWQARLLGDFNGDGRRDILWQHTDGRSAIWLMDGVNQVGGNQVMAAGQNWHATRVGDFNGDGRSDIVWQHRDGRLAVWLMNGASQVGGALLASAGSGWRVKRAAAFSADGRDDLLVQHTDGSAQVWLMNGTTFTPTEILKAGSGWVTVP